MRGRFPLTPGGIASPRSVIRGATKCVPNPGLIGTQGVALPSQRARTRALPGDMGRDRVLAIRSSQSQACSEPRVNRNPRCGSAFTAREDARPPGQHGEGSRPRDPFFAEPRVFRTQG
jgi:hypothetical protein